MIVETYLGGEFYAESTLSYRALGTKWQNSSVKHQRSVDILARSMAVMTRIERCPGDLFHLQPSSLCAKIPHQHIILSAVSSTDDE